MGKDNTWHQHLEERPFGSLTHIHQYHRACGNSCLWRPCKAKAFEAAWCSIKQEFHDFSRVECQKKPEDKPLVFGDTTYGDLDFGYTLANDRNVFPKDVEWIPWRSKSRKVVNKVRGGYQEDKTPWAYAHNNISEQFSKEIDRAFDEDAESVVLSVYCDVDDCTHGFYSQYMDPIQKAVPGIEIAVEVYFSNCGDEDDEDFYFDPEEDILVRGYGYKGSNDAPLQFDECGKLFFNPSGSWIFPKDADWIPWTKEEE